VIETAKANGLVSFDYLNGLLSEIPMQQRDETTPHLLPLKLTER
jgi:hypothetical protein